MNCRNGVATVSLFAIIKLIGFSFCPPLAIPLRPRFRAYEAAFLSLSFFSLHIGIHISPAVYVLLLFIHLSAFLFIHIYISLSTASFSPPVSVLFLYSPLITPTLLFRIRHQLIHGMVQIETFSMPTRAFIPMQLPRVPSVTPLRSRIYVCIYICIRISGAVYNAVLREIYSPHIQWPFKIQLRYSQFYKQIRHTLCLKQLTIRP